MNKYKIEEYNSAVLEELNKIFEMQNYIDDWTKKLFGDELFESNYIRIYKLDDGLYVKLTPWKEL